MSDRTTLSKDERAIAGSAGGPASVGAPRDIGEPIRRERRCSPVAAAYGVPAAFLVVSAVAARSLAAHVALAAAALVMVALLVWARRSVRRARQARHDRIPPQVHASGRGVSRRRSTGTRRVRATAVAGLIVLLACIPAACGSQARRGARGAAAVGSCLPRC
jgi:hypothetical protein